MIKMNLRVFVGAPFTKYMSSGKEFDDLLRDFLKRIYTFLSLKGHTIISAHIREDWGDRLMNPNECTVKDFEDISDCDLFLVFPGNSCGVHIELGWASALNKHILICIKDNKYYSPLIYGLCSLSDAKLIRYSDETELLDKLSEAIAQYENK